MSEDLLWVPGWQLRELYRARAVSPLEVAHQLLDRIARLNETLHAFLTVDVEQVLRKAREAEAGLFRDEPLGPLHGLFVSIKDTIPTKGLRTTFGSLLYERHVPAEDAVLVERLQAAGAIVIGKTNAPEFELSGRTVNRLGPECVNPWNNRCTAGGSSGGAGASVAAGMCTLAIGTDGGGSIRYPAAFNGVFGLLTGAGRIPKGGTPEEADLLLPVSRHGPITRSVRDAALLLDAMAGWDRRDPYSSRTPPPDHAAALELGVSGLRVAWLAPSPQMERRDGAEEIIRKAAATFESLGAHLDEVALDVSEALPATFTLTGASTPSMRRLAADPKTREKLTPYVAAMMEAPAPSAAEELAAWRTRARLIERLEAVFRRYDLLLTPTTCFAAPERPADPWAMFMPYERYITGPIIANLAGLAAASVPCGFVKGLPLGLQIISWRNDEAKVLRASRAFEQAQSWAGHRPSL